MIDVDDVDRHWLERGHWLDGSGYPTVYMGNIDGWPRQVRLHRLIMNPGVGKVVDHRDGNKLNNRRDNLRVVQQAINCLNHNNALRSNNQSGVRGVWYDNSREKWVAQITTLGGRRSLGRFALKEDAVKARIEAEKQERGFVLNAR